MTDWDQRFFELSNLIGKWSKDRATQVGCIIVGPYNEIRSTGYNGFPRSIDDDVEERHLRPEKYLWTEHAERNAIYNAARIGVSLQNCCMYSTRFPCTDCARGIVQCGITELVAPEPNFQLPKWGDNSKASLELLHEAKIKIRFFSMKA